MKILKVYIKGELAETYRLSERAETHPQEFVKDIIYKDGNFTVCFSDDKEWFKTFANFTCEYSEFGEMKTKTNKGKLLD